MSKEDVLAVLNSYMNDPSFEKAGNELSDTIEDHLERLVPSDRKGVVEALGEWMSLRKEPYATIALLAAERFVLTELRQMIEDLGREIESGKIFHPYYMRWIRRALKKLSE